MLNSVHTNLAHANYYINFVQTSFLSRNVQVSHERTHQEKSLECQYCEMRFLGKFGLIRHARVHSKQLGEQEENQEKQELMSMEQEVPSAYHRDKMQKDEDVKKNSTKIPEGFSCNLCGFKTAIIGNMKRHLDGKHELGWGKYECIICKENFNTKEKLGQHMKHFIHQEQLCDPNTVSKG